MVLPRLLTAAVGIPLVLYLVHCGGLAFLLFVTVAAMLALYEYALTLWLGGRGVQRIWTVLGGGLIALSVGLAGTLPTAGGLSLLHPALTLLIVAALLIELFRSEHSLDRAAVTVFGALFIGWTLGHLALLRGLVPHGRELTYLLFAAVWAADTCAYALGLAIGKRRLAEVISPHKSWEGAVAGFVGAMLTVYLAQRYLLSAVLTPQMALLLGAAVGVLAQLSDLTQSLVKRAAGAKDSSSLLPGHGGLFDRFDSLLLLTPVYYYLTVFFL